MAYFNTIFLKVQKGFNSAILMQHGFQLQTTPDGKFTVFGGFMEQNGLDLYNELLKMDFIQKLLVYQKCDFVINPQKIYDEQFIGYLYLKRTTWTLPCHKMIFSPTWQHVSNLSNANRDEAFVQKQLDADFYSLLENKHPNGFYGNTIDENESYKIFEALKH